MARLKIRVVAMDADGDAEAGATVKFYQPGTAAVAGSSTTGTPFAGNLYAGVSGGSPVSTSRTADSTGQVVVYTDTASRCDVGVETSQGAAVFPYEEFQYDPADLALGSSLSSYATKTGSETLSNKTVAAPVVTGQALFAAGTAAAPGIAFSANPGSGLRASGNQVMLRANNAVEWLLDGNATPAGPRSYIVDATGTKSALTLTRGSSTTNGNVPDSTYSYAFAATSFNDGGQDNTGTGGTDDRGAGGEAIKGFVYAVEGHGGLHIGVSGVAETTSAGTWAAYGTHGIIGVYGQATGYKASTRTWGANFRALQLAGASGTLSGVEIGAGASVAPTNRYGIQVVTLSEGSQSGTGEDIGMKFVNKNATAANRWADAVISFNSPDDLVGDGWPAQSTATLIKAYNGVTPATLAATAGVDFSEVTFSGNSLDMPKFKVKGNGRVSVNTNTQTTEAPLYIDATGEAYPLRIDGFSLISTVGAAGGASALPATPSGYMQLRSGATTYKIPLYAN